MAHEKRPIETSARTIGTAGHVDHGKTSLVAALTSMDTDRLDEEKRRGVSIDLGFAHLDLDGGEKTIRAALVDVPGHERFIRNMLAGTTGIDLVLIVVAADDGVMPQTREHFDIVRLLGIEKAVFVITKVDLVGRERIEEVKDEVAALVKSTRLERSPLVTFSAVTGAGLDELKKVILRSLLRPGAKAAKEGLFRLPVDRSFAPKGFGTVVTGTVAGGGIRKGEEAVCLPTGAVVKVRGIQSTRLDAESVFAGQRAALNISGIGHRDIRRGFVLASPALAAFFKSRSGTRVVDCLFEFTSTLPAGRDIKNRLFKLHHMTDDTLAALQLPGRSGAAAGGEAGAGEAVWGRLILRKPLLMLRGDRFILRDPSVNSTVGGGTVFVPYLSRDAARGVTRTAFPDGADAQNAADDKEALKMLLSGRSAFERETLSLMLNLSADRLDRLVARYPGAVAVGGYVVDAKKAAGMEVAITGALSAFHASHPDEAGVGEGAVSASVRGLFSGLSKPLAGALFKELLSRLLSGGALEREGGLLRLASHRPALSGTDARIEEAFLRLLSSGIRPPLPAEIAALGFKREDVARVAAYLQRTGVVVRIKEGAWVSSKAIGEARERLSAFIKANGRIRAADFRDLIGCGRKLAIEILEYFDRERVTLRSGDERTLR
ncbi:MAG: selenocysteine-specific translation elongation factor [Thermodesulfobacteriota bacterium]|nr:MAG: selenocysteine-specific translation elongation factor [Thermodesulfobacteriota bacterium]